MLRRVARCTVSLTKVTRNLACVIQDKYGKGNMSFRYLRVLKGYVNSRVLERRADTVSTADTRPGSRILRTLR